MGFEDFGVLGLRDFKGSGLRVCSGLGARACLCFFFFFGGGGDWARRVLGWELLVLQHLAAMVFTQRPVLRERRASVTPPVLR